MRWSRGTYAKRINDLHFLFRGEVRGANSRALDAVASMDRNDLFHAQGISGATRTYQFRCRDQRGWKQALLRGRNILRRQPSMANVNTAARQYAPAISAGGCEIFSPAWPRSFCPPARKSTRRSATSPGYPFHEPVRVKAIEGFAEVPSLSPDGGALYHHAQENGRFVIKRVTH